MAIGAFMVHVDGDRQVVILQTLQMVLHQIWPLVHALARRRSVLVLLEEEVRADSGQAHIAMRLGGGNAGF